MHSTNNGSKSSWTLTETLRRTNVTKLDTISEVERLTKGMGEVKTVVSIIVNVLCW